MYMAKGFEDLYMAGGLVLYKTVMSIGVYSVYTPVKVNPGGGGPMSDSASKRGHSYSSLLSRGSVGISDLQNTHISTTTRLGICLGFFPGFPVYWHGVVGTLSNVRTKKAQH